MGLPRPSPPPPAPPWGARGVGTPTGPPRAPRMAPRHDVSALVIKVPFVKPDVDSESQPPAGVHSQAAPSISEEQAYVVSLEIS